MGSFVQPKPMVETNGDSMHITKYSQQPILEVQLLHLPSLLGTRYKLGVYVCTTEKQYTRKFSFGRFRSTCQYEKVSTLPCLIHTYNEIWGFKAECVVQTKIGDTFY